MVAMVWIFLTSEQMQLIAAGAMGGLVRWLTLREPWRQGLVSLIVGTVCARYMGPIGVPLIEPIVGKLTADPQATIGLSGFIIGVGGIAVAGFVLDIWNAKRKQLEASKDDRERHDRYERQDRRRDDSERPRDPTGPTSQDGAGEHGV